ncbi:MAG: GNAT family N-acetyltransferase [Burkholderiaceae bacterium]
MNDIELTDLQTVQIDQLISLMNDQKVRKHLPLLDQNFSVASCREFLKSKEALWAQHGYGPWAFVIQNQFAGWGGLQPEHGEADFALVLHPKFWGWGRRIFDKIKAQAFGPMNLQTITALLPTSRSNARAITRLGFVEQDQLTINQVDFTRYRYCRAASD